MTTTELHLDFESRSTLDPGEVGLHRYIWDPTTEPLFLWYKIGNSGYQCWRIWEEKEFATRDWLNMSVPQMLDESLNDPSVPLVAFHSPFERYMLAKLGWNIPASRFIDPQVGGRYLSLPASLDVQCQVLGVPAHLAKDSRGKELIKLFSEKVVTKAKKATKKTAAIPSYSYYNDWNSHPTEWAEFLEYGRKDVVAEEELLRRERMLLDIPTGMPLPPSEYDIWLLDQKINDRGMPADRAFVEKMYRMALRAKEEAKTNFEKMTGVENANSPSQIKKWAVTQGYPYPSIGKDVVASALKDPNLQLSDTCRAALKMRKEAASTSYQKLGKILDAISPDNFLRGQFIFMGSSRCGRWSGNAVQLHNLARPVPITAPDGKVYDFEDQKVVQEARILIHQDNYEAIMQKYGTVLLVVKNLIRTVFVAPGNEGR